MCRCRSHCVFEDVKERLIGSLSHYRKFTHHFDRDGAGMHYCGALRALTKFSGGIDPILSAW